MADNIPITPGTGKIVATDEVVDGTLGTVQVQYTKLMDGTIDGTNKLIVSAAGAAKVDGSAVTQPISATSLPLPSGAATESTLSTLNGKVTTVNTGAVTISTALPSGTNVIGHVIADSGSTTAVTGNVTVVQPTGTNLHTVVDSGTIAATQSGTWNITNISGTVSLPTGASTSANQTTANTNLGTLVTNSNDVEATISFTTIGQTAQIALEGHASAGTVLTSMGTGGQIVLEGSLDNVGWFSLDQYVESSESWQSNTITVAGNYWSESIGALGYLRARCTAITSGTITGLLIGSTMAMGTFEFQQNEGTSLPFNAVYVGGKTNDGSPQFRPLPLGTTGRSVIVEGVSGGTAVATNTAQVNGSTVVTAATGVQKVGIVGNAGAAVDAAGQNAASPANEILVAGQFNTTPTTITNGNVSPLQLNAMGALITEDTASTKAVFAACAAVTTPAATTTDFMTIYGSGTKTIRVLKIEIAYTATALADLKIFIVKRSATNTGGTSTSPTIAPFDSTNTATGTVLVYTANPTALGAVVGTVSAADILVGGTTTVTAAQLMYSFDFTNGTFGSGIVLRGTTQGLAVNMNGAAVPTGGSVNTCNITWIEE